MRVKVSGRFKVICGKDWRKEVKSLVEEAVLVLETDALVRGGRRCDTYESAIRLPVVVTVNKKIATVTVLLDCLSELEECEVRVKAQR